MEKFVSLEKLLFTHKPLARRITALRRNLIKLLSEGAGKIQKPLVFLHFSAFLIYSHSIVAGGLLVMSYTIRLMWSTSLMIRLETFSSTS